MKNFTPRKYQWLIIDHILTHDRCAIWAGMGTGKTASTLTALQIILTAIEDRPALVIAPLRVAQSTWPDEIAKWDHLSSLTVSVVTGTPAKRAAALKKKADIYCTNYEQIPWLVEHLGKDWPFGTIVCDESTRLKGFRLHSGTMRAKALSKVAFMSPRFIELTGTPTANGLIDLWGQSWFLDKGKRLGVTMSAYEQGFFYPVRVGGEAYMVKWLPRAGSDEKIKKKLNDLTVTVNAEDWFDIKKPIVTNVPVHLPPKVMDQYKTLEADFMVTLEGGERIDSVNALSKMGKCLQFSSGAVYLEDGETVVVHREKIEALNSIVEEASGAPVLVSYQYKHEAERILNEFKGAKLLDKNPQTIRDWNAGKIPMLLAHPAACGHGLNLQDGGNILVFFSTGFNFEQYAQMCERIGPTRQAQSGHPRPVWIYHLVTEGTLDHVVLRALGKKEDVLDFILGKNNE